MYFVKLLWDVNGMMSVNTHMKGVLAFRGVFDISFLFIVKIWHDVQNGSGSTLRPIYCQIFSVSPDSSDLVDMCTNLWWNNSKKKLFLGINFFDFDFSFIFTKDACLSVSCAVISPRSVHYFWINPCKTLHEKGSYFTNSLT